MLPHIIVFTCSLLGYITELTCQLINTKCIIFSNCFLESMVRNSRTHVLGCFYVNELGKEKMRVLSVVAL